MHQYHPAITCDSLPAVEFRFFNSPSSLLSSRLRCWPASHENTREEHFMLTGTQILPNISLLQETWWTHQQNGFAGSVPSF